MLPVALAARSSLCDPDGCSISAVASRCTLAIACRKQRQDARLLCGEATGSIACARRNSSSPTINRMLRESRFPADRAAAFAAGLEERVRRLQAASVHRGGRPSSSIVPPTGGADRRAAPFDMSRSWLN